MNPWPVVLADLRSLRWIAWIAPVLVAIAVSIGVALSAQERGLRHATAQAAADFDLLIGAPGSQTQLVLTAVYLQPEALPLVDGAILAALAGDPRAKAAAPIAFGDIARGYPIVGTTAAFVTRWGRLKPAAGRVFEREGEAIVGADVQLAIGDAITPSHAHTGQRHPFGTESAEEIGHRHEAVRYQVVGRLPRLGSPWDRAILIPIESVWETHGLGNGHAADASPIGPPFNARKPPGVPAIVVKPNSVADAYGLRSQYRQGGTMAFFPAEVLVSIYQTIGDVRDLLLVAAVLNDVVVFAAVSILLLALAGLRRRRYAVLRALGATRLYVLLSAWLGAVAILAAGCAAGLALAQLTSLGVAALVETRTGLTLPATIAFADALPIAGLIALGSLLALMPALAAFRIPVADALRHG
jgi:putative ABC transport system permease protein